MWVRKNSNDIRAAYNFIFDKTGKISDLNKIINKCWYAYNNGALAKEDSEEFVEIINAMDIDDDIDLEEIEDLGYSENKNTNSNNNEYYEDYKNKTSTQGYLHDRTFVVKENNAIVVYKTDFDKVNSELEILDSIAPVKTYEGNNINIEAAHMFLNDASLLLLDKSKNNYKDDDYIYRYDLNKIKIVQQNQTNKKMNINSFTTEQRYGNMTENPMLIGMNSNAIFTLDPRINKSNKTASSREYAKGTKTLFKNICTSQKGNIIVGSADGKIRLYKNNIHSKTSAISALPTLGDPIKSVDTTNDGRYILATCNNYLLVINTIVKPNNGGQEMDGFEESITKHVKSLKLNLSPLDYDKYNLYNYGFTPAKFNVGKNDESNIVSSIGDYIVNWNFKNVKRGIKNDYKIKKMTQNIKNNDFMFDKNELIITMDKNVGLQHKFK